VFRAVITALLLASPAAAAVQYQPPVPGPITEAFRPPATRYSAGHRGVTFAATAGEPVHAAAAGTVTFAGQVAGTLIVVVRHADRIRTTYAGLARIDVAAGQEVAAAQPLGTATGSVYFGARAGAAYLDPAVLLAPPRRRVRLVPVTP